MKVKQQLLFASFFLFASVCFAQNRHPFQNIGKKGKILTLTKGEYEEFFDQDSIQQIGTCLINVHTMKVVKLLTDGESKLRLEGERHSRFKSVDPLASSYPMLTPYQFASNSPIAGIDLDGLEFLPRFNQSSPLSLTMWSITKKYDKSVTSKIINGTAAGVEASTKKTWLFFTSAAYKPKTWSEAGKFLEETALDMSAVRVSRTPRVDAKVQSFVDKVINGDAYSRSEYIAEFGTDLFTAYAGSKGLGSIKSLVVAKYMSGTFTIGAKTLARITAHLEQFGMQAENEIMLSRMAKIVSKELKATEIDINFAKHELREAELMKAGNTYREAHKVVLKEQGMGGLNVAEYEKKLYTKEALDAGNAAWEKEIKKK